MCRLLDENRELYVPELQEVVKPHAHFMLWGTQNPPGAYGGRKQLSRAFRTRFLELHVGEFPESELAEILHKRCAIAPSYAAKMVAVMRDLERRRQVGSLACGRLCGGIMGREVAGKWGNFSWSLHLIVLQQCRAVM